MKFLYSKNFCKFCGISKIKHSRRNVLRKNTRNIVSVLTSDEDHIIPLFHRATDIEPIDSHELEPPKNTPIRHEYVPFVTESKILPYRRSVRIAERQK